MQKINIKAASIKDLDDCYFVESECFPKNEAAPFVDIKKRIEFNPEGFFIAKVNDKIAGFLNTAYSNEDILHNEGIKKMIGHNPKGENVIVLSLAILPEFRGLKIANHLFRELFDNARKQSKSKILLLCKKELINFYEKQGFSCRGLSKSRHGGSEWYEMEMRLSEKYPA